MQELRTLITAWAQELGFERMGVSDTELSVAEQHLLQWLRQDYQGDMSYMARHGNKRSRPANLVPGTVRVLSLRMNYLPENQTAMEQQLLNPQTGYISRYATGRDYHKLLRKRLQQLADRISGKVPHWRYRVFTDSAPVLEKPLAHKAGLGWLGKHTNLIDRHQGSWFFLGEIYTDLPLPVDEPGSDHCGSCTRCIDVCPTGAIVAPYVLDARKCISYLTIEHHGSIPEILRPLIGNRIYGCDDCQLYCPWNRFATVSQEAAFTPRQYLLQGDLTEFFSWTEQDFLRLTAGTPIRRIGHERWLRNLAVALGNAPTDMQIITTLRIHAEHPSSLVREHVRWALARHQQ